MPQKPRFRAVAEIDPGALADFQAGIHKRYSDDQILADLQASAGRLGRSPTMREFAADAETSVHPQTVIEHFGSWNAAKRAAGLVPRRFATREELLGLLRTLGEELGRPPTARDIDEHKGRLPSKSLYWHTFGSLTTALREAGFDVPVGEERLERAVDQGVALAEKLGRLPKFADWAQARRADDSLLTEWQVYRMFDARRVVDVPVPRSPATLGAGPGRRERRDAVELGGSCDHGEAREAVRALTRRPDSRQGPLLDVGAIGKEAGGEDDAAVAEREEGAVPQLGHPEPHGRVLRGDLERGAGRGEEDLVAAATEPERPADAAGGEHSSRLTLV